MRRLLAFAAIISLLSACSLFQKHPGYSKTGSGIYYKLHFIGEEVSPPKVGDYVTASIQYATESDSVFFTGHRTFQLTAPDYDGAIDECFLMLSVGDSASFYIDAEPFFLETLHAKLPYFINPGDELKINIRVDEIRTESQYAQDKEEFLKWIEDFGDYEKHVLSKFILEEKIDVEPLENGMYYISVLEGTGKSVEYGDLVTVDYEGKFLNGKFFDSTKHMNQPFEFVYGAEMQVIKGIDEAIGRMREGGKAIIILPSSLAWGDKGSTTGIIPPFTSVIYEVTLIKAESRSTVE